MTESTPNASPPATTTTPSLPRTLVLLALSIHFISLFFEYQDNTGTDARGCRGEASQALPTP